MSEIQTARQHAAEDSCQLLVGLVHAATPPRQKKAALAYIKHTPLHDCRSYGLRLRRGK